MSGDVNEARKLLAEKAALRSAELAATERHLDRLREGRLETIETTSLHLDVLRDLRRIHSHICSVAYPVLDAAGELDAHRSLERTPIELSSASGQHERGLIRRHQLRDQHPLDRICRLQIHHRLSGRNNGLSAGFGIGIGVIHRQC